MNYPGLLTHRERFKLCCLHKNTDRAVFDLCGSPQTRIDYQQTRDDLCACLGYFGAKEGDYNVDERILFHFDIDTRSVGGMPTPTTVHNREENGIYYDNYGIGYKYINGHYEICVNPLKGCTIDEMMAYPMPEADNIDILIINRWAEKAKLLHEQSDFAVVAEHPFLGVFELGCWMFGFDDYLYRLAGEPELVHAFSKRILEYQTKVIDMYYGALGKYIDCTTSGDDFGTQTGPFMSVSMFDEMIKPYYKTRIAQTKKYTDAFYKHHTCGSVHAFIPSFIECGIDILNPIQPNTYMMEPERLKADYGDKMTFWGGVDTQCLLPVANVQEVKEAVRKLLSVMDKNGGFILAPAHCIQPDVPAENVAAIYEGAREYYKN